MEGGRRNAGADLAAVLASARCQEAGGWNATGIANGGMSLSFLGGRCGLAVTMYRQSAGGESGSG